MNTACGHLKVGQNNFDAIGTDVCRGTGFHNFLNGFHARPDTGKATECNGVNAKI